MKVINVVVALGAIALVGVGAAVVMAASPDGGTQVIQLTPPPEQHKQFSPMAVGESFVTSVANVCVQGEDVAVIDSIELIDGSDIVVEDFAVTPGVSTESGWATDLDGILAGHNRVVEATCAGSSHEPAHVAAVNVQVSRTSADQDGTFSAYKVNWSSGDASGSFESPLGLTLCDSCAE